MHAQTLSIAAALSAQPNMTRSNLVNRTNDGVTMFDLARPTVPRVRLLRRCIESRLVIWKAHQPEVALTCSSTQGPA